MFMNVFSFFVIVIPFFKAIAPGFYLEKLSGSVKDVNEDSLVS